MAETAPTDEEVLAAYPGRGIDHDNLELYRGALQRRLVINRCLQCETWHHPPRSICPACWSDDLRPEESTGRGVIYMSTALQPPRSASAVGQLIVTADLDDQPSLRFTAPLVDSSPDEATMGRAVELCWIEHDGAPAPAFRLVQ